MLASFGQPTVGTWGCGWVGDGTGGIDGMTVHTSTWNAMLLIEDVADWHVEGKEMLMRPRTPLRMYADDFPAQSATLETEPKRHAPARRAPHAVPFSSNLKTPKGWLGSPSDPLISQPEAFAAGVEAVTAKSKDGVFGVVVLGDWIAHDAPPHCLTETMVGSRPDAEVARSTNANERIGRSVKKRGSCPSTLHFRTTILLWSDEGPAIFIRYSNKSSTYI